MAAILAARARLPPALQRRDFALFALVVLTMNLASQMIAVAIGWQVYAVRHRPFDLGLIGLLEFAPVPLLALPGGQLADRVSRRLVLAMAIVLLLATAAGLIVVSETDAAHSLWPFLVLATASGVATALSFPVSRALPAGLVERELLPAALTLRSVTTQTAMVAGPALGGILFAVSPPVVYGTAFALFVIALGGVFALRVARGAPVAPAAGAPAHDLLGGVRFIRRTPILLGAILLDLFAVLFGGAVALLPVFAQSVLHTGPAGLGVLRSAPAVGAVAAGVALVRWPLAGRTGATLIGAVTAFGVSMIVFGLSRSFGLSLAALAISGAVDMVSVNIRTTTATLVTPDRVRGRVGAVEAVFVGASNQLGAFESGVAAALLGAIPAVVAGGSLTVVIALAWIRLFPGLAALDRMTDLSPQRPGHGHPGCAAGAAQRAGGG